MPSIGQAWQGSLPDGSMIQVDPVTNRATINRDGVQSPMWDGYHRLQDGSVLTIRLGQAVPNQGVLQSRQNLPEPAAVEQHEGEGVSISGYSLCERLVRRVCGTSNQCEDSKACNLASQLLDMEFSERNVSRYRSRMTFTSGQCKNSLKNHEAFVSCDRASLP